jgi:amidase
VQKAIDSLKTAGADVIDVTVPGLDDLLRDSSMIAYDFKFDLADYLAKSPDAPVKSLADILDRGLLHTSLESNFKARNALESRDNDQSRRARIKRVALRQAVEAALDEQRLTAFLYPTLRRKPARLSDGQGPSNCQLSASSGLPALGLPAGFTDDGLPVGMDLLAGSFHEESLLSLGYSIEQTLHPRHPPFSTPPLISGKRPAARTVLLSFRPKALAGATSAAGATLQLTYDETAGRMEYVFRMPPAVVDQMNAVWIHSGTIDKPGTARHELYGARRSTEGSFTVSAADRADLASGHLMVRVYLRDLAGSAADLPVSFNK